MMTPKYSRATVSLGVGGVNVRKGPGIKYQRFDALEPGHKVCIIEEIDGWVKIVYDNPDAAQGWSVRSAFVLEPPPEVELPCDVEPPPPPDIEPLPEKPLPPAKEGFFRKFFRNHWDAFLALAPIVIVLVILLLWLI